MLFCFSSLRGCKTMGRGRPVTLKNRQTTCISLEDRHREYLKKHNKEASQCFRDYLDSLIQDEESPIEQLEREAAECDKIIKENEMLRNQKLERIKELRALKETESNLQKEQEEFEQKKYAYVNDYKKNIGRFGKCTNLWLNYLLEAWKFKSHEEAKSYVHDVWVENGVPDKNVKAFLGIK